MAVLIVLTGSLLLFRALGAFGVERLRSWKEATRYALAVMFAFTAASHFTSMRHDLVRMVPKSVPYPEAVVAFTGVCELLGAIGLLIPRVQRFAGIALIVFLLAVFPANIRAAREALTVGGRLATPLVGRLPMQILFIILIAWVTQTKREDDAGS
jgi:uncharacterized membrane protein